jgi:hypothetical protein
MNLSAGVVLVLPFASTVQSFFPLKNVGKARLIQIFILPYFWTFHGFKIVLTFVKSYFLPSAFFRCINILHSAN